MTIRERKLFSWADILKIDIDGLLADPQNLMDKVEELGNNNDKL